MKNFSFFTFPLGENFVLGIVGVNGEVLSCAAFRDLVDVFVAEQLVEDMHKNIMMIGSYRKEISECITLSELLARQGVAKESCHVREFSFEPTIVDD